MSRRDNKRVAKQRQAARDGAMARNELRVTTTPRAFPKAPMAPALKVEDAETRRIIDAALAKRGRR